MAVQQLSTIRPDPQDLKAQLQAQLSSKNSWKDLLTSGVGETILEFIASIGAYDQYSIERAFKEMFEQTARQDSNIFGATRQKGVRLKRKTPAGMKFTLQNNSLANIIIPAYTQMSVGGASVFNRLQIIVPPGGPYNSDGSSPGDAVFVAANGGADFLPFYLYEGQIKTNTGDTVFTGTGRDFQAVISNEDSFVISDSDVQVFVNSVLIERVTDGLWNYKVGNIKKTNSETVTPADSLFFNLAHTDLIPGSVTVPGFTVVQLPPALPTEVQVDYANGTLLFYWNSVDTTQITVSYRYYTANVTTVWQDLTTAQGNLQIQFGNTLFGYVPSAGDEVRLLYVITKGLSGNDASLTDLAITYAGQSNALILYSPIGGGGLTNGTDEISARLYKSISSALFAAQDRAVTQQDYNNIALLYPDKNILDAVFWAQRDLDATNNTFMNLCKVWVLYYNNPADTVNPGTPWTDGDFNLFVDYMQKRSMYALRFFYDAALANYVDPVEGHVYGAAHAVPIDINVSAVVSCQNFADLNEVRTAVEDAINDFLELRKGSISRDIYVSDIMNTIKQAHPAIDYVNLQQPTENFITDYKTIDIVATGDETTGSIPAGTYEFKISAVFGGAEYPVASETRAREYATITVGGPGNTITLTWNKLAGATGYNIYGAVPGNPLLITASVTGNTFTYSSPAQLSPLPGPVTPPNQDASGVRYPRKGTVNISTVFTYR